MAYLTLAEVKSRSAFEPKEWDVFLASRDAQLGEAPGTFRTFIAWSGEIARGIDDMLRRRYIVPFDAVPGGGVDAGRVPESVKAWSGAIFDERFARARRYPGTTDPVDADIAEHARLARQAMTDAANPDNPPAPELPLRADLPGSSGVVLGGPIVIAFQTAFTVFDGLAERRYG